MSNQLRTVVQRSVDAYHAFFARYKNCPLIRFKHDTKPSLCTIIHEAKQRMENAHTSEEIQRSANPPHIPPPVFLQKMVHYTTLRSYVVYIYIYIYVSFIH